MPVLSNSVQGKQIDPRSKYGVGRSNSVHLSTAKIHFPAQIEEQLSTDRGGQVDLRARPQQIGACTKQLGAGKADRPKVEVRSGPKQFGASKYGQDPFPCPNRRAA